MREHEGLIPRKGILQGSLGEMVEVDLDGLRFRVDIENGQKTGLFLDQRQNWLLVGQMAKGKRVLDAFCYTGAFAAHALQGGAQSAVGLEISEAAAALARQNLEMNGMEERCRVEVGNAFDRLRAFDSQGERFDLIVLDPPSFTRSREAVEGAARGYKEINLRAFRILNPGGILVTCSCSYHLSEQVFRSVVNEASQDAKRRVRLLEVRTQSPDHPMLPGARETQYLKCLVLQVA